MQNTTFGKTYLLRNVLLGLNVFASLALVIASTVWQLPLALVVILLSLMLLNLFTAAVSRALFYILVIPTTMPGAFFWKNKGFEQHARDIGLADNPNSGVVHLHH